MPEVPTTAPLWLTIVLPIVTMLVGNLAKPLVDLKASRDTAKANAAVKQAENAAKAAESLRDDMLKYVVEVRSENATLKSQHEETRRWYIQTANALVDFRTFVMTEAGHAQFHNDRKEHDEVARHLDNLIGGAKRLRLPLGGHSVPTETDAG